MPITLYFLICLSSMIDIAALPTLHVDIDMLILTGQLTAAILVFAQVRALVCFFFGSFGVTGVRPT